LVLPLKNILIYQEVVSDHTWTYSKAFDFRTVQFSWALIIIMTAPMKAVLWFQP